VGKIHSGVSRWRNRRRKIDGLALGSWYRALRLELLSLSNSRLPPRWAIKTRLKADVSSTCNRIAACYELDVDQILAFTNQRVSVLSRAGAGHWLAF